MKRLSSVTGLATLAFALVSGPTGATPLLFDFNALKDDASNGSVQSYMRGVLSGAAVRVSGAQAEREYDGDGHVVGPVQASSFGRGYGAGHANQSHLTVSSETLGSSDGGVGHGGALDTFLVNAAGTTRITMTFPFSLYVVSFDYAIFPDGTCPVGACQPSSWPDFTFRADGLDVFRTLGVVPGSAGTYAHSPASGATRDELAPQFIGLSGTWVFPSGVTQLEFVDWPRTIAIDNLVIDRAAPPPPPAPSPTNVPEPSAFVFLAAGLASAVAVGRRSRLRAR